MKSVGFNAYKEFVDTSTINDFCRKYGRMRCYSKGEAFVLQGDIGKHLGVIESGYFKYTTITTEGNEAVVGFAFEGECVCDFNNSFSGLPSQVSIIAGSEATVRQANFTDAKNVIETRPDILHSITIALFREIYCRYLELYRKSPTERYIDLINNHPDIFDVVPLKEIASYLMVTPIYLSRIRKRLTKNKAT